MSSRRETLLDAAIRVLGGGGMRALTHRAVDAEAGVPAGSTANYFSTRDALVEAIVERVSELERGHFDQLAVAVSPRTPAELGRAMAGFARDAADVNRSLTLSRFAVLVEAGNNPGIRRRLAETGGRVNAWLGTWLRLIGSHDTDHDVHVVANYLEGLILHQLAIPDPAFEPTDKITAVLESLVGRTPPPAQEAADGAGPARTRRS